MEHKLPDPIPDDGTPLVLTSENNINIQLHAIEYPDEENAAVVVFDIYSDNHGTAGRHRRIALVRRTVPLNGTEPANDNGTLYGIN